MGKTIWTPTDPLESQLRAGTSSFLPHFLSEARGVNKPRSKKWENRLYLIDRLAAKSPGKGHGHTEKGTIWGHHSHPAASPMSLVIMAKWVVAETE